MAFDFSSLKIDPALFSATVLSERRAGRIKEAIAWPGGPSVDKKVYHTIWPESPNETGYSVKLGKPGKEINSQRVNVNDMTPSIFLHGNLLQTKGSFTEIFEAIEDLIHEDKEAASVVGALLFRSAYMLDHTEISSGVWRLTPPKEAVEYLHSKGKTIYNLPPAVFLAYLDAIGWNEDVKYKTLGYDVTGKQKMNGRLNNMLTYVNIFGVLMHAKKVAHVFAGFANGRGISSISLTKAAEAFPYLELPKRLGK